MYPSGTYFSEIELLGWPTAALSFMPVKVSVGKSRVGLGGLDGVLMACVAIGAGAVASD